MLVFEFDEFSGQGLAANLIISFELQRFNLSFFLRGAHFKFEPKSL